MFYLTKFCRICVQAGVKLVDIETADVDSITLSEKLKACTKMVLNGESLSKEICLQCIKKLRICYEFQHMCKQSTKILEGYLKELISTSDKVGIENFVSSELRVTLTPLSKNSILHYKRKRITKEERCSLLKKLLSSNDRQKQNDSSLYHSNIVKLDDGLYKGGLRDIINFTANYDFGYKIDDNHNLEATPLDKLTAFSNNFFKDNFTEFNQTILNIIESRNDFSDSDDDSMFDEVIEGNEPLIKVEEVIIEPDIKIKSEVEEEEECENYAANFVETTYTDCDIKKENAFESSVNMSSTSNDFSYEYVSTACSQKSSMSMLDSFVEKFSNCRTFSKHSVRCRTRESPYINPQLKEQFQKRCFKCTKCSRYFKSPGYLKAHISKIHLSRVHH